MRYLVPWGLRRSSSNSIIKSVIFEDSVGAEHWQGDIVSTFLWLSDRVIASQAGANIECVYFKPSPDACVAGLTTSFNGRSAWGGTAPVKNSLLLFSVHISAMSCIAQLGSLESILWIMSWFTSAQSSLWGIMGNLPGLSHGNVQSCPRDFPLACPFFSCWYNMIWTHFKTLTI